MTVSIHATSRERVPDDPTGRDRRRRTYDLVMNWPLTALGPDADEAISVALRAADTTGMLHDGIYRIEATVEWEPTDG